MNRTFRTFSRTESAALAVSATLLSVMTVGTVVALFSTTTSDETLARVVLEPVVITVSKAV